MYRRLAEALAGVTFVTHGDRSDLPYRANLGGISLVCNRFGLPQRAYDEFVSRLYPLREHRPTVVKTNQLAGADLALRAARRWQSKFVARCGYFFSHFNEEQHGFDSPQAVRARALEQKVLRAADAVVVTSKHMGETVADRYGVSRERIRVVPNYVDAELFKPDPDVRLNGRRLCFVGRLEPQKNLFALLEAVEGLDVELMFAGDGRLRQRLAASAAEKGIQLSLLGAVPTRQLPAVIRSADAFILPTLYEGGHPKVLLEVMACGVPVIACDVHGPRELIRHGETGYLTGTAAEEIRTAIEAVLGDAEFRQRLGKAGQEFVVPRYSLETILVQELAMLESVARL